MILSSPKMVEFTLTELEQYLCRRGAKMRFTNNRKQNIPISKVGPQSHEKTEIIGLGGEIAVARWLNIYPDLTTHTRQGGADLISNTGKRIDVKTTMYETGKLLAMMNTAYPDIDIFVLVTAKFPVFIVRGWATKEELLRPDTVTNLGYNNVHCLAQDELHTGKF